MKLYFTIFLVLFVLSPGVGAFLLFSLDRFNPGDIERMFHLTGNAKYIVYNILVVIFRLFAIMIPFIWIWLDAYFFMILPNF